jgi:hypothetical protein
MKSSESIEPRRGELPVGHLHYTPRPPVCCLPFTLLLLDIQDVPLTLVLRPYYMYYGDLDFKCCPIQLTFYTTCTCHSPHFTRGPKLEHCSRPCFMLQVPFSTKFVKKPYFSKNKCYCMLVGWTNWLEFFWAWYCSLFSLLLLLLLDFLAKVLRKKVTGFMGHSVNVVHVPVLLQYYCT